MMWSEEPYLLTGVYAEDGDPLLVSGRAAGVMRSLDEFDPIGPDEHNTMTDSQTRLELLNYLGDFRWCTRLDKGVVRGTRDMYTTIDADALLRRVELFLGTRVTWARDALRRCEDEDQKRAKAYLAFASKQDTTLQASRMVKSMRSQRPVTPDELDKGAELMGTPLGVLSLKTGELLADRDELCMMMGMIPDDAYTALQYSVTKRTRAQLPSDRLRLDFRYDPRWDTFIDEITDGDAEKAAFLQRALGYSLYGGNPEKATFVLWGLRRDNGKSTLMNVVKHALGDYADTAPAGLLLVNRNENYTQANPVLAKLVGKRLVDVSEPPLGAELNGAMVKKLASGTDELSTRQLNNKEFTYVPQFTLWMHCNALPVVLDPTAIDPEHMFVIEFTRSFTGKQRDLGLVERFKTPNGMYTVMTWLLQGYLSYRKRGLDAPQCVREATGNWLGVSKSWLDFFLQERCEMGSTLRCTVADFNDAARAYCEQTGDEFQLRGVKAALKSMNIVQAKGTGGRRYYKGLSLLPMPEETATLLPKAATSEGETATEGGGTIMLQ